MTATAAEGLSAFRASRQGLLWFFASNDFFSLLLSDSRHEFCVTAHFHHDHRLPSSHFSITKNSGPTSRKACIVQRSHNCGSHQV